MIDEPRFFRNANVNEKRTSSIVRDHSMISSTMTPEMTRDDVAQNASAAPSRRFSLSLSFSLFSFMNDDLILVPELAGEEISARLTTAQSFES